jgi:hypothetical protein
MQTDHKNIFLAVWSQFDCLFVMGDATFVWRHHVGQARPGQNDKNRRHRGRVDMWLHLLLTLALDGVGGQPPHDRRFDPGTHCTEDWLFLEKRQSVAHMRVRTPDRLAVAICYTHCALSDIFLSCGNTFAGVYSWPLAQSAVEAMNEWRYTYTPSFVSVTSTGTFWLLPYSPWHTSLCCEKWCVCVYLASLAFPSIKVLAFSTATGLC